MKLKLSKIAEFIAADYTERLAAGAAGDQSAIGYSIDSRTIAEGQLFFAVKGERLDGHDFVDAALERGAIAAGGRQKQTPPLKSSNPPLGAGGEDPLVARHVLGVGGGGGGGTPRVGGPGAEGKTRTKEPAPPALPTQSRVLNSEATSNTLFGLPLVLLNLDGQSAPVSLPLPR